MVICVPVDCKGDKRHRKTCFFINFKHRNIIEISSQYNMPECVMLRLKSWLKKHTISASPE